MLVTWQQFEEELQRDERLQCIMRLWNVRICSSCQEHYEPCVGVLIGGVYIWHLVPISVCVRNDCIDCKLPFCGNRFTFAEWRGGVYSKYVDLHFLLELVQRYPKLLNAPLTERILREAGCDIEVEWVLWQLAGGE
jgi:hypothetical protein